MAYTYRLKSKNVKFVMRLFGITFQDIAKAVECNNNRAFQIIGGRSVITREEFLEIKQLINDEVMGRALSTVELAERIK